MDYRELQKIFQKMRYMQLIRRNYEDLAKVK